MTTFTKACCFLQLPNDPVRVQKAIRFSDFKILSQQEADKGFKERPGKTARFFREGQSGGWRIKLTQEQVQRIVSDHGPVMARFGYLNASGQPIA